MNLFETTTREISTILPPAARTLLAQALRVDPGVSPGESPARARALDAAVRQIKAHYPRHFRFSAAA